MPLQNTDTVYLGSVAVTAAHLISLIPSQVANAAAPAGMPVAAGMQGEPSQPERTAVEAPAWAFVLIAAASLIPLVVIGSVGSRVRVPLSASAWEESSQALAWSLFCLGLSVSWLGISSALLAPLLHRTSNQAAGSRPNVQWFSRVLTLAIGLVYCLFAWLIAKNVIGLKAADVSILGFLAATCFCGYLMGMAITTWLGRSWRSIGTAAAYFCVSAVLGGPILTLSELSPSALLPSRWCFEGLLTLEADARPTVAAQKERTVPPIIDQAERLFPIQTDRMGPAAAATALAGLSLAFLVVWAAGAWESLKTSAAWTQAETVSRRFA